MRSIRTPFIAVPVWVYESPTVTPTIMQVYLALAARSIIERKPPKGIGWLMESSGLGRSAVYGALATLRECGAVIDHGEDLFLPTDPPSARAESVSIHTDDPSALVDDPSALVDRASLLEGLEIAEVPSTDVDTFDAFWATWPKRNGKKLGREKASTIWRGLDGAQRSAAMIGASHYAAASNAGIAGAMDAHRWLRDRAWTEWQEPAVADRRNGRSSNRAPIMGDETRTSTPTAEVVKW